MAITRMTVIKASSDADYRKGQDIFLIDKRIKNFETDINTLTDTPMITATVLDADGSEHETQVSIDEDEGQIVKVNTEMRFRRFITGQINTFSVKIRMGFQMLQYTAVKRSKLFLGKCDFTDFLTI